jgi:hypothetical protein
MTLKTFAHLQNPLTTLANTSPLSQVSWTPSLVMYDTHKVLQSILEYLCAGFGASPRPRMIPQYLRIVPISHRTFLAVVNTVSGSSVMLVAACVHYRLHWDAGLDIVEYQYPRTFTVPHHSLWIPSSFQGFLRVLVHSSGFLGHSQESCFIPSPFRFIPGPFLWTRRTLKLDKT